MKPTFCLLIFLNILFNAYSQDYDLVVTATGDSIACKIDSITDASVYFEMKHNNRWIHTNINRNEVIEYKYDAIDKKAAIFKPGTSYVDIVYNEQDAILVNAQKLNKTGKTLTNIGVGAIVTGPLLVLVTSSSDVWTWLITGSIIFSMGVGLEVVGIPMRIISSKRIKRINAINNTANNGIIIDLMPSIQHNFITENYQPGLTLRIRF